MTRLRIQITDQIQIEIIQEIRDNLTAGGVLTRIINIILA
jgi:phosphotransferase system IIB component